MAGPLAEGGTHQRVPIAMDDGEVAGYLASGATMTVATYQADGTIHLSAMWYTIDAGTPVMWTNGRSQKVANLRRDPRLTVLVESGQRYHELAGVQLVGRAELISDESEVLRIGRLIDERYQLGVPEEILRYQATKRIGIRIFADRVVSWDHAKL